MEELCCGRKMVSEVNEELDHIKYECVSCGSWRYKNYFPDKEESLQVNGEAYWRERALLWKKEALRLKTERNEIMRMYNRMNNGYTKPYYMRDDG